MDREVLLGDSRAVSAYQDRSLLICWPPRDTDIAFDRVARYAGRRLIYIGEPEMLSDGRRGCTANQKFFDGLRAGWKLGARCGLRRWSGVHDAVFIYERPSY